MTQKYYVENLLSLYVKANKSIYQINDKPWLLQEDRDPSHGIWKASLVREYKDTHNIQNLVHPT